MTILHFNDVRRLSRAACLVLAGVAALSGCGGEPTEGSEAVGDTFTSFEEFEAQTYREPDTGFYIVDGDVVVATREELHAFYEQYVLGGALINKTVNGTPVAWSNTDRLGLTYCVSTSFGNNHAAAAKAMNDAAAAWFQAANVRFIHMTEQDGACDAANTHVVFDVRPITGATYYARAFSPGDTRPKRSVMIDADSFANPLPLTLTGILRHELGHVLGFRHEHTRPQSGKCYEDNNWSVVSSYDPQSVMHYAQCNGTNAGDLILTERDRAGAAAVYGRRHGGAKNLAYGKGATQSSNSFNLLATNATDGNIDGVPEHKSITHTDGDLSPWWQVDLGSVQDVGDVVIHNRADHGASLRLTNFKLMVSKDNVTWRTISYPGTAGGRVTLPVSEAARYIKIQLTNNGTTQYLHLAEVEVLEARNLARGKAASQSSLEHGGVPERAVDGSTNGSYFSGSVTHTNVELSPWWQVDLGGIQPIGDVVLYNRTDCCADRLTNFKLRVSNDGATWTDYAHPAQADTRTRIAVDRPGRFVRVELNNNGSARLLSLAEVEVLAGRNLARGKTATQSSEFAFGNAPASLAIDGFTGGDYTAGSVTHTSDAATTPWWQVDLGSAQHVGEVVLYNRTDCCSSRLSNFKVMLSADGATWVEHLYPGTAGPVTTVIVNNRARYVKVQLNNTGVARPLSLAEVEVLAARNLATSMPASQSSTYVDVAGTASPSRAVDGNTDGNYANASVSHTDSEAQPWWQVDLGSLQPIGEVVLWNRTDGFGDRLSDFNLRLSEDGTTFTSFPFPGIAGERTAFETRMVGRYVKVQLNGTNPLQLAEVEVILRD